MDFDNTITNMVFLGLILGSIGSFAGAVVAFFFWQLWKSIEEIPDEDFK